jgi:hypothetical protein
VQARGTVRKIANGVSYLKSEGISPRERILSAASDMGVETIAEEAKTNKMTLYRHFTSKTSWWLNIFNV